MRRSIDACHPVRENTEGQPSQEKESSTSDAEDTEAGGGECVMIVDERMVTFINSLDEGHTEFSNSWKRSKGRCSSHRKKRDAEFLKVSDGGCPDRSGSWKWEPRLDFLHF